MFKGLMYGLVFAGFAIAAVPLTYVEMKKDGVGGVDGLNSVSAVIVSQDGKHV